MTTFSVNTADLQGIATVFSAASSDVGHLHSVLAGASAPDSASVMGNSAAAAQYRQGYTGWLNNLTQLTSSLETMSAKTAAAARYYAQTESGNTVRTSP